ncbi:SUKH-4 family immunity protein [Nocardia sp. NPDC005978]|uniref:SUKH-4 family immunity protein n=1 Tax=Nocardia sp. NPDC005978 TaxID=3156725 RepID=UPI0033AE0B4A
MTTRQQYVDAWGIDNIFEFPRAEFIEEFRAPVESYPEIDFIPTDMSVVFTSYLEGGKYSLYDSINLRIADDEFMPLVIIGAVPSDPDSALFCFDANGGRVVLLGTEAGTLELVNSTFKALSDFLYQFALFIDADTGIDGRAQRASVLFEKLRSIDEAAFKNPESWWTVALTQLGATLSR